MIPHLDPRSRTDPLVADLARSLAADGFSGEVLLDTAHRVAVATDNSVYQRMPEAVVHPRNHADVVRILSLLGEERYHGLTIVPRGGGTGTSGGSLADGIVLDLSRHLRRVIDINPERMEVRVEAGVVLSQLNDALRPYGLVFGPTVATADRATIGGMVANDSAGKGSCVHGKTSEHVLELRCVLPGGETWTMGVPGRKMTGDEGKPGERARQILGEVQQAIADVALEIPRRWPSLQRFLTGYNLPATWNDGEGLDPAQLICGAEGTLAVLTEATLKVVRIPTCRRLVALGFSDFDTALHAVDWIAPLGPVAIEAMDEMLVELGRSDAESREAMELLPVPVEGGVLLLVEFAGDDAKKVDAETRALITAAGTVASEHRPAGMREAMDDGESGLLWRFRSRAVGLLGALPGSRRPVPFVEDCVVPPEHLPAFIAEFRDLLRTHGLDAGMFGHIDVGCLHVRPALDLRDPADEALIRIVTDGVVDLVVKYGGVLWGEHGKGLRSEYGPALFGQELYGAMCRIKAAFDPRNQLNPGKIAVPRDVDAVLLTIEETTRGSLDRQVHQADAERFSPALACNGNGQCFSVDQASVMCPSFRLTGDRVHSPKGRAMLLREWLRLLAAGQEALPEQAQSASFLRRLVQTMRRRRRRADFSTEVHDALHGCLGCKACATSCPIQVDIPAMRGVFKEHYHTRYLRPARDHLVGRLERTLPMAARWPRMAGHLLRASRWMYPMSGLVDLPVPAVPSLRTRLRRMQRPPFSLDAVMPGDVVLVQDVFTTVFEPDLVLAALKLLSAGNGEVHLAPLMPSGKALHVCGFGRAFARQAMSTARALDACADRGGRLVGLDPAVTLVYRDEYRELDQSPAANLDVLLLQEMLEEMDLEPASQVTAPRSVRLLGHCTERSLLPGSDIRWASLLRGSGFEVEIAAVGCCGMCGVYGHEREHAAGSRTLFDESWSAAVTPDDPSTEVIATGYSCRSQVHRCTGRTLRHPVQLLAEVMWTSGE